jgi:hypothetical protein
MVEIPAIQLASLLRRHLSLYGDSRAVLVVTVISSSRRACLERARLLNNYSLHNAGPNAQGSSDLQNAHAVAAEGKDSLFHRGPAHAPALFTGTSFAVFALSTAHLDASSLSPRWASFDAIHDHRALELSEHATHLKHRTARWGGSV